MAILLVLLPPEAKACLSSDALNGLSRLGITHVALVRDEGSLGVLVEGWAFDPAGSAEAVIGAVTGRTMRARAL